MRNKNLPCGPGCRLAHARTYLALTALCSFPLCVSAFNDIELVLDGYAYAVSSDIAISLGQQTINIPDSDLENCLRPGNLIPLNNADLSLITNNQAIGISRFKYFVFGRLVFLTSETSNVVCDNGIFVDQIFVQSFEQDNLIFSNGFED